MGGCGERQRDWLPPSLPPSNILTHCGVRWCWEREEVHRHKEPQTGHEFPITAACKQRLDKPVTEDKEPEKL